MALLHKMARPTRPKQFRAIELRPHALGKQWDCALGKIPTLTQDGYCPQWAYVWQAGLQTTGFAHILTCTEVSANQAQTVWWTHLSDSLRSSNTGLL